MKIGLINGVYREEGYDHLKTLELAAGKVYPSFRADIVQAYLNPQNLKDKTLLEKIREKAKEYGIELISHIHGLPKEEEIEEVIMGHLQVLQEQKTKRAVIHFDDSLSQPLVAKFNSGGIRVYVENFHRGMKGEELVKHERFVNFVLETSQNHDLGAVLDFGRYFISEGLERVDGIIKKIATTYKTFKERNLPVFFHTIGSRSFEQKREDWVSPGSQEDLIPQLRILKEIIALSPKALVAEPLILECESANHVIEGVKFFKSFISMESNSTLINE